MYKIDRNRSLGQTQDLNDINLNYFPFLILNFLPQRYESDEPSVLDTSNIFGTR